MSPSNHIKPFRLFSRRSKTIGALVHRDVETMSDQDYKELKESFKIIEQNLNCCLKKTRETFLGRYSELDFYIHKFSSPGETAWSHREIHARVESRERMINVKNTVNYIYSIWLQDREDEEALKYDPQLERYFRMKYSSSDERKTIEALVGKNFDDISPSKLRSIYESLKRLSYKYVCPLEQLKDAVLSSFDSQLLHSPEAIKNLIEQLRDVQAPAEAKEFKVAVTDTGQWLISDWLVAHLERMIDEERMINGIKLSAVARGVDWSSVERTEKELNLVPDLTRNNNLENKLFRLAKELANYIGYYYKTFPELGYYEALTYCCILLVKFRSDFYSEVDLDVVSDCLFVLLSDEVIYTAGVDDFIEYFNQRVVQWGKDEAMMAADPDWKPLSLYAALYVAPFQNIDDYATMPIPVDADIDRFKAVLQAMKTQLVWRHSDWNKEIKLLGEEIRSKVEELKNKGLTHLAISQIIGPLKSEPYGLEIDQKFRIWLDNPKHSEVMLSPIHKAVYLLFIKHPEGIRFKDMEQYRDELEGYYTSITHRNDYSAVRETINRLVCPYNNSMNEKCARIKSEFARIVPEDLVVWYSIEGDRGDSKAVTLPRYLINWL